MTSRFFGITAEEIERLSAQRAGVLAAEQAAAAQRTGQAAAAQAARAEASSAARAIQPQNLSEAALRGDQAGRTTGRIRIDLSSEFNRSPYATRSTTQAVRAAETPSLTRAGTPFRPGPQRNAFYRFKSFFSGGTPVMTPEELAASESNLAAPEEKTFLRTLHRHATTEAEFQRAYDAEQKANPRAFMTPAQRAAASPSTPSTASTQMTPETPGTPASPLRSIGRFESPLMSEERYPGLRGYLQSKGPNAREVLNQLDQAAVDKMVQVEEPEQYAAYRRHMANLPPETKYEPIPQYKPVPGARYEPIPGFSEAEVTPPRGRISPPSTPSARIPTDAEIRAILEEKEAKTFPRESWGQRIWRYTPSGRRMTPNELRQLQAQANSHFAYEEHMADLRKAGGLYPGMQMGEAPSPTTPSPPSGRFPNQLFGRPKPGTVEVKAEGKGPGVGNPQEAKRELQQKAAQRAMEWQKQMRPPQENPSWRSTEGLDYKHGTPPARAAGSAGGAPPPRPPPPRPPAGAPPAGRIPQSEMPSLEPISEQEASQLEQAYRMAEGGGEELKNLGYRWDPLRNMIYAEEEELDEAGVSFVRRWTQKSGYAIDLASNAARNAAHRLGGFRNMFRDGMAALGERAPDLPRAALASIVIAAISATVYALATRNYNSHGIDEGPESDGTSGRGLSGQPVRGVGISGFQFNTSSLNPRPRTISLPDIPEENPQAGESANEPPYPGAPEMGPLDWLLKGLATAVDPGTNVENLQKAGQWAFNPSHPLPSEIASINKLTGEHTTYNELYKDAYNQAKAESSPVNYDWSVFDYYIDDGIRSNRNEGLKPGQKIAILRGSVLNTPEPYTQFGLGDRRHAKSAPIYPSVALTDYEVGYRRGIVNQSPMEGDFLSETINDSRANPRKSSIPISSDVERSDPHHPAVTYEPAVDPRTALIPWARKTAIDEQNQPWAKDANDFRMRTHPRDAEMFVPMTYDTRDTVSMAANVDTFTIGDNTPRPFVQTQPRQGYFLWDAPAVVGIGYDEKAVPPDPRTVGAQSFSTTGTQGSPTALNDSKDPSNAVRSIPEASRNLVTNEPRHMPGTPTPGVSTNVRRGRDELNAANQLNPGVFAKKQRLSIPGENVPPNIGRNGAAM
jgi:hypothetical protein